VSASAHFIAALLCLDGDNLLCPAYVHLALMRLDGICQWLVLPYLSHRNFDVRLMCTLHASSLTAVGLRLAHDGIALELGCHRLIQ